MDEQLSSGGTTLIKFVLFPLCVLVGLAPVPLLVLAVQRSASPTTLALLGLALCLSITLDFVIGKWLFRCQHVVATETGLRIGPPGRAAAIAYSEIADVKDFKWSNPHLITVILKSPKPRFVFLARSRVSVGVGEHPVAALLRNRAGL